VAHLEVGVCTVVAARVLLFGRQKLELVDFTRFTGDLPVPLVARVLCLKYQNVLVARCQQNLVFEVSFALGQSQHSPVVQHGHVLVHNVAHVQVHFAFLQSGVDRLLGHFDAVLEGYVLLAFTVELLHKLHV